MGKHNFNPTNQFIYSGLGKGAFQAYTRFFNENMNTLFSLGGQK
jgi:hypothetical protein